MRRLFTEWISNLLKLVEAEPGFEDRELALEATVLTVTPVALQDGVRIPTQLRICSHQLVLHSDDLICHSAAQEPQGIRRGRADSKYSR